MIKNVKLEGQQGRLMGLNYFRMMPQPQLKLVGSFFLLDHFPFQNVAASPAHTNNNIGAHPHRGITTVTYVIEGENEHRDSLGNHAIVSSGGLQWMKAGSGIVHDEGPTTDFSSRGGLVHMMQFWLVLDAQERDDEPSYYPLHNSDVQEKVIDDAGSKLRVLIGSYCSLSSPVPYKREQFMYHLRLMPQNEFFYTLPADTEVAILNSRGALDVDGEELKESSLLAFDEEGRTLSLLNPSHEATDIMIFGGTPFGEAIYSQGPFVMGDRAGIVNAYDDFYAGKYGEVLYDNKQ